jgi:DNA-binding NarL/FixJ family response regulator
VHGATGPLLPAVFQSPVVGVALFDSQIRSRAIIQGSGEEWRRILSQREHEVLKLLADCKSNKDVASELNISVRTAETYQARVMMKLELRSIGHLIRFAVRNNIIKA